MVVPIADFFQPAEVPGNFPLLRHVHARKAAGDEPFFELYQPREGFGLRKAKIVIHFLRDGREVDYKDDYWDDGLNAGLVQLGVRAENPDGEKDRFTLGLRAALRAPENRYGDGYFNSMIVQYALGTDFHTHDEVAAVLKLVKNTPPEKGQTYDDCWKMIDAAVKGRAAELIQALGYEMNEAWDILAGAMARYVDERFSVTNRRLLGLI